jgi:alkanesulfonate monooxygenase SsuD/methylene tetrahydromethanopterin reductase-like flavin-dependent oxidoreductase (luciferase family)
MSTITIGTGVPTAEDPAHGVPSVVDAARRIEELGFESVWVPDLIIGDGTPALEAALTLAAVAAVTERVTIGFSVLVVPLRPAPWLATQIATLQHLSGNRLVLGVGSGGFPGSPFWQSLDAPVRERGRVTDTTLELLPRLLSGKPVTLAEDQPPLTLAPSAPMPPVLVGGSERAFHRVLAHGQGWFPSLISPADLAPAVTRLRDLASEHGLPTPTVTVGGHAVLGTDQTARTYDALVRDLIDVHHMPPDVAARTPMTARTPEELAEIFAAYEEAGADRVVTGADNGDWTTQLEFMAEARALLG